MYAEPDVLWFNGILSIICHKCRALDSGEFYLHRKLIRGCQSLRLYGKVEFRASPGQTLQQLRPISRALQELGLRSVLYAHVSISCSGLQ